MVADTSAIIAILMDEPERPSLQEAIRSDGDVLVSAATAVELLMVATGKGESIYQAAIQFLQSPLIRLIPFNEEQLWAAAEAFRRFGRGRSPASLNFGDTFAYALATTRQAPLLFKGRDFTITDVAAVLTL